MFRTSRRGRDNLGSTPGVVNDCLVEKFLNTKSLFVAQYSQKMHPQECVLRVLYLPRALDPCNCWAGARVNIEKIFCRRPSCERLQGYGIYSPPMGASPRPRRYTWPGSSCRPSAFEADVMATRPEVPLQTVQRRKHLRVGKSRSLLLALVECFALRGHTRI